MEVKENSVNASLLTKSEKRVARLISCGMSEKEIANKLSISPITVNNHTRNIRSKYGVTKNTELLIAYIAELKGKRFDLSMIREYGVAILLVIINICSLQQIKY